MKTPATLRRAIVPALVALAAFAPVAGAANRTTALGPGTGSYTWSATGTGWYTISTVYDEIPCQAGNTCDDTLINVKAAGTLSLATKATTPTNLDTALKLFESDESGTVGKQLKSQDGAEVTADESLAAEIEPGWYIVRIMFLTGAGTSSGEAKFEPLPGGGEVPVAPVAPTEPAPVAANSAPSASSKVKSRNKSKSLKSFSGTATDADGTVSKVQIAVVSKKGSKCKVMRSNGSFKSGSCKPSTWLTAKGTDKWSYKLRKRLAKGKYLLYVRATDDKGTVGDPSRRSFSVS